jgi:hypothetical protein
MRLLNCTAIHLDETRLLQGRGTSMRVTIIKSPEGDLNGMSAVQWQVGRTYDLSPSIASVLIVEGYARLEMRSEENRRHIPRFSKPDRRSSVPYRNPG